MKLLTKQGIIKSQTECAPNNGYFLIPLYDKVIVTYHIICVASSMMLWDFRV